MLTLPPPLTPPLTLTLTLQTDSLSATTPLSEEMWSEQHIFSIEWRANNDGTGYMRWLLDGVMYFELPETLVSTR